MADNLIATISQFLTPDLRAKIAGALGLDPNMANKALGAAVPAILSSLGAVASTSGGAAKISDVISNQDLSVLDGLGAKLDSDGPMGIIEGGSNALSSLVGGAGMSALTGAISKFSGADSDTAGSVLGLMGPIVTGVIGQQDPNNWTSGAGIANLFASQKSNIAAALPAGLGSLLSAGGIAGAAAGVAGAARSSVTQTASAASSAARTATDDSKGGIPMWVWLIGALVLAFLAWHFLKGSDDKPVAAAPKPAATATAPAAAPAAVDVASVTKTAGTVLDGLKTSLGSITDAASAKAALPQLTGAAGEIDKLAALTNQLPAAGKSGIASMIAASIPVLKAQADKVLALPGVGDVAKPAVDAAIGKLEVLAK